MLGRVTTPFCVIPKYIPKPLLLPSTQRFMIGMVNGRTDVQTNIIVKIYVENGNIF